MLLVVVLKMRLMYGLNMKPAQSTLLSFCGEYAFPREAWEREIPINAMFIPFHLLVSDSYANPFRVLTRGERVNTTAGRNS